MGGNELPPSQPRVSPEDHWFKSCMYFPLLHLSNSSSPRDVVKHAVAPVQPLGSLKLQATDPVRSETRMSAYEILKVTAAVTFPCQRPLVIHKDVSGQWRGEPSSLLKCTYMCSMLQRSKLLKDEWSWQGRDSTGRKEPHLQSNAGSLRGCEMLDAEFYFPFHSLVYLSLLSALTGRHSDWIIYFFLTSWSSCCFFYLHPTLPLCQSVAERENRQQEMQGNKMFWILFWVCKRAISKPYKPLLGFYLGGSFYS